MELAIISPEKTFYSGKAESVMLPGLKGSFTILERHAPIISGLGKGTLSYRNGGESVAIPIGGGFVEAKNNIVTVCVE
ncbi:MAG: F0F1 ATP synthase subunit epsilon [Dysgonamonadaceae bacterium]|jgi:F-type H+-transporting ATPase subunit epsilon|nr:F0F1 ATP synthase subunit epsilon [Dysgonamonadaceae bacterium]